MWRDWTKDEIRTLREMRRARRTYAECAAALGISEQDVYNGVRRFRLKQSTRRANGEMQRLVRECWEKGFTDRRAAVVIGTTRITVRRTRGRMGLPCHRDKNGGAVACLMKNGAYPCEVHADRKARERHAQGWPRYVNDGEFKILVALEAIGKSTREQIRRHLGYSRRQTAQDQLRRCRHLGWVIVVGKIGKSPVYDLAMDVRERRLAHVSGRQEQEARRLD